VPFFFGKEFAGVDCESSDRETRRQVPRALLQASQRPRNSNGEIDTCDFESLRHENHSYRCCSAQQSSGSVDARGTRRSSRTRHENFATTSWRSPAANPAAANVRRLERAIKNLNELNKKFWERR
jgi:hypothetical protein